MARHEWQWAAGYYPSGRNTMAPIFESGSMMRAIGRRRILASPVRTLRKGERRKNARQQAHERARS